MYLKIFIKPLFIAFLVLLAVSSCVRMKDLGNNQAFLKDTNLEKNEFAALKTPYFLSGKWPELLWWESFEDPELNMLIHQALEKNPSILAAKERVDQAKQLATETRSTLFPFFFSKGKEIWSYTSKNDFYHFLSPEIPRNFNHITLNLGFDYEFDFWAKYSNQFLASLGKEQVQKADKNQAELLISVSMAQAFFALKAALMERELVSELVLIQKKSLNLAQLLYDKALFSKIPPATFKQELDQAEKMLYELENDVAQKKHLVNILRAQSPSSNLDISFELKNPPASIQIPKDISSDLMIRRPDLLGAIWRVVSLAYDVNAAVADFFPRINLQGLMGYESVGYRTLLNWQSAATSLIPSFHIPIFKAGAIKARYRFKKAELYEAIYDYDTILLKSLQEISDILVLLETLYEQKKAQDDVVKQACIKVDLVQLRKRKGIDNLLQVYLEEAMAIKRKIEQVKITYNQYIAIINLIKSLGGGYTDKDMRPLKISESK